MEKKNLLLTNPFDAVVGIENNVSYEELVAISLSWWRQQLVSRYVIYKKEMALFEQKPGEMVMIAQIGNVPRIEIVKMKRSDFMEAREAVKILESGLTEDVILNDPVKEPDEKLLEKKAVVSGIQKKDIDKK